MTLNEYFKILGLPLNASTDEIRKAYRKKARLYHPDINPSPEAKDLFIMATEAYEFLISYREKTSNDDREWQKAMDDWRKYRQDRTRRKAAAYANASYRTFRNTRFYKTTRIFDGTTIIFSFLISLMVITYTIIGYTYRLHHPLPDEDKPSVFAFIMLLCLGLIFMAISLIHLKAYVETSRKHRKKS